MDAETTTILIDTALASGSATAIDPEQRRLQELVLAIRDDAPEPGSDFALRMHARVSAGFPSRRRVPLPALRLTQPRVAAFGAAAVLLIAIVVALSQSGHDARTTALNGVSADGGSAASTASAERQPVTPSASGSPGIATPAPAPVPPGGFVGGSHRQVERTASLVLAPDRDKLDDVGNQVIAVSDRYHGIVMQSSVTQSGDSGGTGSFDLRIPVRNLQPALRDLSALADVTSRTESSGDVTGSFVNARTRLNELTAERRGLLRRLEKAPTDRAAAAIRARLRIVTAEIQAQTGQLTELRRRTSYATVNVALQAKAGSAGGGGIGGGARDLRDSLVDAAATALRVLGVALPIALLAALLWAVGGWAAKRRREAALD